MIVNIKADNDRQPSITASFTFVLSYFNKGRALQYITVTNLPCGLEQQSHILQTVNSNGE